MGFADGFAFVLRLPAGCFAGSPFFGFGFGYRLYQGGTG